MSTERDIHFKEFATLLVRELYDATRGFYAVSSDGFSMEVMRDIAARRAYDLVKHIVWNIDTAWEDALSLDCHNLDAAVERFPDMSSFPEPHD